MQVKLAMAPIRSDFCFNSAIIDLYYLPQHFLNLKPLPQAHGSFLPTFVFDLMYGLDGSQQLELLQQESSLFIDWLLNIVLYKKNKSNLIFIKRNNVAFNMALGILKKERIGANGLAKLFFNTV